MREINREQKVTILLVSRTPRWPCTSPTTPTCWKPAASSCPAARARDEATTRCAARTSATEPAAAWTRSAPGHRRAHHRRRLCQSRTRARHDPQRHAAGEVRAGRDGDVLHLSVLDDAQRRLVVWARILRDRGDRLRSRRGHRTHRRAAGGKGPGAHGGGGVHRPVVILDSVAGGSITYTIKSFPSPSSGRPWELGVGWWHKLSYHLGMILVVLLLLIATCSPLVHPARSSRCAQAARKVRTPARLVGIHVASMLALGCGLAFGELGADGRSGGPADGPSSTPVVVCGIHPLRVRRGADGRHRQPSSAVRAAPSSACWRTSWAPT